LAVILFFLTAKRAEKKTALTIDSNILHNHHRAVIVAVSFVMMMQPAVNQIIGVIAVRHGFVRAVAAVRAAAIGFGAFGGILVADLNRTFVNVRVVHFMQMPVVQVIGMIAVFDLCMPAVCFVRVRMIFVCRMCHKFWLSPLKF
jgi:hypothetical protein